jgi:hypothetical protein
MGVGSEEPSRGCDASAEAVAVYRRFLDALNRQDLAAAEACVDPARYRENCVGFTDGYVDWAGATASVQTIWKGLPDLHVFFGLCNRTLQGALTSGRRLDPRALFGEAGGDLHESSDGGLVVAVLPDGGDGE